MHYTLIHLLFHIRKYFVPSDITSYSSMALSHRANLLLNLSISIVFLKATDAVLLHLINNSTIQLLKLARLL